jgi:hypothetical protein
MHISPQHAAAVYEACRLPTLYARLELLAQPLLTAPERSTVAFYATDPPAPGTPPGGDPIVTLNLTRTAGVVLEPAIELRLGAPIEAQITGAVDGVGSIPKWARVTTWSGIWWADLSVTANEGGGDIEIVRTGIEDGLPVVRWYNGAFVRLTEIVLQG